MHKEILPDSDIRSFELLLKCHLQEIPDGQDPSISFKRQGNGQDVADTDGRSCQTKGGNLG